MRLEALVRVAVRGLQGAAGRVGGTEKPIKVSACPFRRCMVGEVHEAVAERGHGLEVHGHVEEVEGAREAVRVQQLTEILSADLRWEVLEDEGLFSWF